VIRDVWVVAMQEWRSIRRSLMPSLGDTATLLMIVALFGFVVPFGISGGWLTRSGFWFLWFWLPWLIIAGPVSDSFAGEREHHTLEALFATRLSDSAILLGKVMSVCLFGSALTLLALATSGLVAGLAGVSPSASSMSFGELRLAAALTPLAALLASTTGALLSLSARSARQANQATIAVVPVIFLLGMTGAWLLTFFPLAAFWPADPAMLGSLLATMPWLAIAGLLMGLTAITFVLASVRLHRCRVLPA
jgi:ABC-2 type transport system permease protein